MQMAGSGTVTGRQAMKDAKAVKAQTKREADTNEGTCAVSPAPRRTRRPQKASPQSPRVDEGEGSVSKAFISFLLASDSKSGLDESDAIACIYLIHRITALLRRSSTAIAEKAGIHVSDLYVLLLLHRRPPEFRVRSGELQRALGFTSGGITRRVDRLEEAGLVVRVPHATDRRIWMVQLTPTGLKMVRESRSSSASAAVNNLIAQFDLDDWGKLLSMLKQIDEALSHQ